MRQIVNTFPSPCRLWQPTRPNMPPTAPLNRLLGPRNLRNRQCLPSKFQQRPGHLPASLSVRPGIGLVVSSAYHSPNELNGGIWRFATFSRNARTLAAPASDSPLSKFGIVRGNAHEPRFSLSISTVLTLGERTRGSAPRSGLRRSAGAICAIDGTPPARASGQEAHRGSRPARVRVVDAGVERTRGNGFPPSPRPRRGRGRWLWGMEDELVHGYRSL
jgi:hypothetical protein